MSVILKKSTVLWLNSRYKNCYCKKSFQYFEKILRVLLRGMQKKIMFKFQYNGMKIVIIMLDTILIFFVIDFLYIKWKYIYLVLIRDYFFIKHYI